MKAHMRNEILDALRPFAVRVKQYRQSGDVSLLRNTGGAHYVFALEKMFDKIVKMDDPEPSESAS
jgi:hypothetical protein